MYVVRYNVIHANIINYMYHIICPIISIINRYVSHFCFFLTKQVVYI